ncbi:enoyl-CoA hydratase/isomerase family protein [Deinococcus peraridilitoris]|uniref:Enoyl-CoA hydratase/carnithine racemase n=1 Tax=Deinococcus peraridilitoris (strain DSM 19664 / LMG 22246 / CIP 109416 / KR-200) TaxID=937777 RepID=L0A2Q7_DEIPD|nr:enoyl-CoA hydratase-related protein [Deinococcus peraridilitoris]AFZ68163.1 enoyl-CoA hydratase/carnithine racemase [Deinococcus peraridilitoris DSM 19664]
MSNVLSTRHADVCLLQLNRPDVRNALSAELVTELQVLFAALRDEAGVRAIVITGAGKAFSAGADLRALSDLGGASSEANKADSARLADLLQTIYTYPKPVIAAVEGAAVAGGAGLASVCDLIVAGEDAKFGYTEVKLGFVAAIVMVFLLRVVGEKHARELLLTGKLVSAPEAWRMGLVSEVVADGEALTRALSLAAEISRNSPTALATTKEMLSLVPGMGLAEALRYAVGVNAWTRTTDDLREGVSAFLEKRDAHWKTEER